jgi:hypothetical protein
MKDYRVTLTYTLNNERRILSTVIPAYNNATAIEKVKEANKISGVVNSKAEEVNL